MYFYILRVATAIRHGQAHCQKHVASLHQFCNKDMEEQIKYKCQGFLSISLSAKDTQQQTFLHSL